MRMGLTTIEYERERERDVAAGGNRGIERHFSPPFGWQRVGSTTNTVHHLRGKRVTKKLVTTDGNTWR